MRFAYVCGHRCTTNRIPFKQGFQGLGNPLRLRVVDARPHQVKDVSGLGFGEARGEQAL